MSALTRRDAIAAGTAVVAGGFAGVAAAVEPTHADPALEAIETRMTAVENRGTTLYPRQKYAVLLAVVTAVGTPKNAASCAMSMYNISHLAKARCPSGSCGRRSAGRWRSSSYPFGR